MSDYIVWALFDSGNGCYSKGVELLNKEGYNFKIYPIGVDIEKKNDHFINLNLADYNRMFGDNTLFDTLDQLPAPDLIIASPPCESWSTASAIRNGNACWKRENPSVDLLYTNVAPLSKFTIRSKYDYDNAHNNYNYGRQFMKRINGELCAFNTIEIIKRYDPEYFIIENPASGRLWDYIELIMGFELEHKNPVRYNNYDYPLQKPTKFASNLFLDLDNSIHKQSIKWGSFSKSYNERSNIPEQLVISIFKQVHFALENGGHRK